MYWHDALRGFLRNRVGIQAAVAASAGVHGGVKSRLLRLLADAKAAQAGRLRDVARDQPARNRSLGQAARRAARDGQGTEVGNGSEINCRADSPCPRSSV